MFDRIQNVKAISIVMKSPMPWGYFGLNDVSLLTSGQESFMIVAGERSDEDERCITAAGSEVLIDSCLSSLASLDGREVFKFQDQRIVHVASGLCLGVEGDDEYQIALYDCGFGLEARDVRSVWELTANAQLKLPRMGDSCLTFQGARAVVGGCGSSYDKFFFAAVPEVGANGAMAVMSNAKLLAASAARQRAALNTLRSLTPVLDSCKFVSLALNGTQDMTNHRFQLTKKQVSDRSVVEDTALATTRKIYGSVGLDMGEILDLMIESSSVLVDVHAKLAKSA